ncbi:MAG TPA: Gfo/Idh/MocA family oxidoreductase [Vicinamibacterales bacterium]|jgi:predicted dehydrogenase|nr:Gfo/Idh/MocA family oxidoreductase [Vicinamibacterales bacterium]
MSARERLRVGVVGVGHLGRHHARILSSLPEAELVAAVDLEMARAQAAVAGTTAEALTDYRALFDRVDAVTIAVPTIDHLRVAAAFLDRGIHVLVEKPMTASLAESDEMLRLAERSGAVLAVGHTERFNPAVEAALAALKQPRFIEIHRLSGFPERSLDIDVVFDVMIHDLDLILAIDPTDVVAVEAVGVPVLTPRIDIANARVKFASGCIANLTASRISRDKVRKFRCFQPDMYVSIDSGAQELEVWRLRHQPEGRPAIEGGAVPVPHGEPLAKEIADFVEAIRDGRAPRVTGEAGRRALALATRVAGAIAGG